MPFVGWKYRKDMQTQREGEREREREIYIYYIYIIYIYLHNKDHMIPPNLHTGPSKLGVSYLQTKL